MQPRRSVNYLKDAFLESYVNDKAHAAFVFYLHLLITYNDIRFPCVSLATHKQPSLYSHPFLLHLS